MLIDELRTNSDKVIAEFNAKQNELINEYVSKVENSIKRNVKKITETIKTVCFEKAQDRSAFINVDMDKEWNTNYSTLIIDVNDEEHYLYKTKLSEELHFNSEYTLRDKLIDVLVEFLTNQKYGFGFTKEDLYINKSVSYYIQINW